MTATRRGLAFGVAVALSGVLLASCSHRSFSPSHIADPPGSIPAKPDYTQSCSPSGADTSVECTEVVLESIDNMVERFRADPGLNFSHPRYYNIDWMLLLGEVHAGLRPFDYVLRKDEATSLGE